MVFKRLIKAITERNSRVVLVPLTPGAPQSDEYIQVMENN